MRQFWRPGLRCNRFHGAAKPGPLPLRGVVMIPLRSPVAQPSLGCELVLGKDAELFAEGFKKFTRDPAKASA